MLSAKKIKDHYSLTVEEEQLLKSLSPVMKEHRDAFSDDFYAFVMANSEMAEFFQDEEKRKLHKMQMAGWFMQLFRGTYDEAYFRKLRHVGKVHVKIKLDGHFVNAAMARVRQFIVEILDDHVEPDERPRTIIAINKILDINLDELTSSYRQEELRKYFISYRLEDNLVSWLERFTHGLNLVLALALGVVSVAVIFLFAHDVIKLFIADNMEAAVVAALGSLLIIWMMIELLDTEVAHLKGRKIPIKLFIGVVLVAFIRKVLIASLQHEHLEEYLVKIATLLVLGIVYWLISRADRA